MSMSGTNESLDGYVSDIVTYSIIGLGQRALGYVKYIHKRSLPFRLVGVYDKNPKYQETFLSKIKRFTNGPVPKGYTSIAEMEKDRSHMRLVFICTPDHTHLAVLSDIIGWNTHVILEKPITTTVEDTIKMREMVSRNSTFIHVPLVLRYTNHYQKVKQLLSEEKLGSLIQVQMTLSLTVSHTASYQRRWHRLRSKSGGFIVTKCCHDIDLLHWVIDSNPKLISSFSRNKTFKHPKKADGCAECTDEVRGGCAYEFDGRYVLKTEMEDIGVYDRCVFDEKSESIDGQCVILMYDNGVLCSYNIHMFQPESSRVLELVCERGKIRSCFKSNKIHVTYTDGTDDLVLYPEYDAIGHNGGDVRFLEHVYSNITGGGEGSHTLLEESINTMNTCIGIQDSSDGLVTRTNTQGK